MPGKEEFIEIYQEHIHREGSAELLDYLSNKSDFFTAPASARYHGAYAGGLCDHSVNVFRCLEAYLRPSRLISYDAPSRIPAAELPSRCLPSPSQCVCASYGRSCPRPLLLPAGRSHPDDSYRRGDGRPCRASWGGCSG